MPEISKVGKRGTVVIPVELRKRFGIEEGSLVIAEARDDGVLIRPAVAMATDEYRRQFFAGLERDYAALRQDPAAWVQEQAERRALDATLMDGLDPEEIWTEDGDVLYIEDTPAADHG